MPQRTGPITMSARGGPESQAPPTVSRVEHGLLGGGAQQAHGALAPGAFSQTCCNASSWFSSARPNLNDTKTLCISWFAPCFFHTVPAILNAALVPISKVFSFVLVMPRRTKKRFVPSPMCVLVPVPAQRLLSDHSTNEPNHASSMQSSTSAHTT